jgi:hypothetical protein
MAQNANPEDWRVQTGLLEFGVLGGLVNGRVGAPKGTCSEIRSGSRTWTYHYLSGFELHVNAKA